MKALFITLACLAAITSHAQSGIIFRTENGIQFSAERPCGTWQAQPEDTTEWQTVDTLGKMEYFSVYRRWVYDLWKPRPYYQVNDLVWTPCGRGYPDVTEQYRVCSLTGIRQKRERIVHYKYIEPPMSEYQRVTDSLIKTTGVASIIGGALYFVRDTLSYGIRRVSDTASYIGHWRKRGKTKKQ